MNNGRLNKTPKTPKTTKTSTGGSLLNRFCLLVSGTAFVFGIGVGLNPLYLKMFRPGLDLATGASVTENGSGNEQHKQRITPNIS